MIGELTYGYINGTFNRRKKEITEHNQNQQMA
jgi:hypothetical protein